MIFLIFDDLPLITNNNLRSSSYRLLSKLQAWKVQEGRIQETQVLCLEHTTMEHSSLICNSHFYMSESSLIGQKASERGPTGNSERRGGRKCAAAFRKRTRNVCKYDGGRITYVKAWKAERTYFHKTPPIPSGSISICMKYSKTKWLQLKRRRCTAEVSERTRNKNNERRGGGLPWLAEARREQKHEYKMVKSSHGQENIFWDNSFTGVSTWLRDADLTCLVEWYLRSWLNEWDPPLDRRNNLEFKWK